MTIGQLTVILGVDTRGLMAAQAAMTKFETTTNASVARMAQKFRTFGYMASLMLTAPLMMFSKKAVTVFKDYEFAMQKIVGLVGVAQASVDTWGKSLLKMAPIIGKAPQELANALYFVTSAGFKTAEALDIVKISAQAAVAGLGETKTIAGLLTSVMRAYGNSNITAAKAVDTLIAAVREGKAEPAEFASQLGQVLPFAAELKVSFEQVAAAMAAMTLTGSSTAKATTYLRNVLKTLMHPSKQSEDALNRMKTSSEALRKTLSEKGLMATLIKIRELNKKWGTGMMADVFPNIRGLMAVLDLLGDNLELNIEITDRIANAQGSLARALAAVSETVKVKMDRATAKLNASMIQLGQTFSKILIPVLEVLIKVISKLFEWFNHLNETTKKVIMVIGMLAAAAGPVALLTSLFLYLHPVILTLTKAILRLGVSILSLNAWWLLLPVGIWAVIKAMKIYKDQQDEVQKIQAQVNKQIGAEIFSLNSVFNKLKSTTEGTKDRANTIRLINTRYRDYLSNLLTEKSTLEDIEKAQKDATNALIANISVKVYQTRLEKAATDVAKSFTKQLETFTSAFSTAYGGDRVGEFITSMYEAADKVIKESGGKIERGVLEYNQTIWNIYSKYIKKISQATGNVKYGFDEFQAAFLKFAKTKAVKGGIIDQLDAMIKSFGDLGNDSGKATTTVMGLFGEIDMVELDKIAEDMFDQIKLIENLKKVYDELGIKYSENDAKLKLFDATLKAYISRGLFPEAEEIKKLIELYNTLNATFSKFPETIKGFKEALKSIKLEESFAKQEGGLKTQLWASMGADTSGSLYKGDWEAEGQAIKAYNEQLIQQRTIVDRLDRSFQAFFENMGGGFQGMVESLMNALKQLLAQLAAKAAIFAILQLILPGSGMAVTALTNLRKFVGTKGYAAGTNYASGGLSLVGERGPELLNIPRGSQVIPNNLLAGIGKASSGGEVLFRIEGTTLVGVLDNQGRKNKGYM